MRSSRCRPKRKRPRSAKPIEEAIRKREGITLVMGTPALPSTSTPLPVTRALEPGDRLPSLTVTLPRLAATLPRTFFPEVRSTSAIEMSMLPKPQEKTVHAAMAVAFA